MTLASVFLSASILTFVVGALARFACGLLAAERSARIAGLCIACGFALGRYSYSGSPSPEAAVAISAALGGAMAVALLWFWLFKSRSVVGG